MPSQRDIFQKVVRDCLRPPPAAVKPETGLGEIVERLSKAPGAVVVVADGARIPLGLVGEGDIVRRALWRTAPEERVETIMATPVVTVGIDEPLFRAVATLRRHKLTQAPVIDRSGVLTGMLRLEDALLAMAGPMAGVLEILGADDGLDALQRVRQAQISLAEALIADGVPAPEQQAVFSEINAELHRRVMARVLTEMTVDGWGEPPAPFAMIVMGSAGRGESLLAPDQDNGFIIADYPDFDHDRNDAYFVTVAQRLARTLDAVGFPFCTGNVMATNPVWRKRFSEWQRQIATWIDQRKDIHLLHADILLDFRHVWGDAELSAALRSFLTRAAGSNYEFVRKLHSIEVDHRVALGWFGLLRKETDEAERPGVMNLKMRGTLPLVEGARLLSIKAGLPAISTLERLEALEAKGLIATQDHDYLRHAFIFISDLIIRQQLADHRAGRPITDYVPEASLTKREREHLVSCFRAIENLRSALRSEFGGTAL